MSTNVEANQTRNVRSSARALWSRVSAWIPSSSRSEIVEEESKISEIGEEERVDWDYALNADIRYIVCKHLSLKDLCSLSQVNISWREVALREKAKRFYIRQLRLPYEVGNLDGLLDVNPCISILIYPIFPANVVKNIHNGKRNEANDYLNLLSQTKELLENLAKEPRQRVLALDVDKHLTSQEVDLEVKKTQKLKRLLGLDTLNFNDDNILGLFFPSMERQARINVHCYGGWEEDHIPKNLGFDDCKYRNSTFLLFIEKLAFTSGDIILHLEESIKNSGCKGLVVLTRTGIKEPRCNRDYPIIALWITGPTVKSWAISIDFDLQRDEIDRKLHELKQQVTPGRSWTRGLLFSVYCFRIRCNHARHPCADHRKIMRNLKHVFPDIPFLGLYKAETNFWFPPFHPILESIQILIIAYD